MLTMWVPERRKERAVAKSLYFDSGEEGALNSKEGTALGGARREVERRRRERTREL